jgi:hypothetical protein
VLARDKRCVICGNENNLGNGHYVRRGVEVLRWNLVNCNCQCIHCNIEHESNEARYTAWMIENYGKDILDFLHQKRVEHTKFTRLDLVDIYFELIVAGRKVFGEE